MPIFVPYNREQTPNQRYGHGHAQRDCAFLRAAKVVVQMAPSEAKRRKIRPCRYCYDEEIEWQAVGDRTYKFAVDLHKELMEEG